jgi:hypothetical protein
VVVTVPILLAWRSIGNGILEAYTPIDPHGVNVIAPASISTTLLLSTKIVCGVPGVSAVPLMDSMVGHRRQHHCQGKGIRPHAAVLGFTV